MDDDRAARRIKATEDRIDSTYESKSDCMISFVAKTKKITTYPTIAKSFYCVRKQVITGNETEGSAPSFADDPDSGDTFAFNSGGNIPPEGTIAIIKMEPSGYFGFTY